MGGLKEDPALHRDLISYLKRVFQGKAETRENARDLIRFRDIQDRFLRP